MTSSLTTEVKQQGAWMGDRLSALLVSDGFAAYANRLKHLLTLLI